MRVAIAQINPILGDFDGNREKILQYVYQAKEKKASMVVFPECSLFGYHPFDLLEREEEIKRQDLEFKALCKQLPSGIAVIVGLISKNPQKRGRPYFNSAAFLEKGKKPRFFHKELLPTGDVFDEARFIEDGDLSKNFFTFKRKKFFLTICEDIWAWETPGVRSPYRENPLQKVKGLKPDLVINLSASPYFVGKMKMRDHVTRSTARWFKAPVLYVNIVGGQDEMIFDGQSFVMTEKGKKPVVCRSFSEELNVFELDTLKAWAPLEKISEIEELRQALVLGIRDFCRKIGFTKIHLGLSGGIDSALVACLAVDALGPGKVMGLALPGPYSAPESLTLAQELAKNLGIQCKALPISETYQKAIDVFSEVTGFEGFSVVNENLQARLRGLFLMAFANKENSLLVTTGNKSEYATGYATLYGDMCGGLAPIADLTKEQVYLLSNHYNSQTALIPQRIIDRPPTAELREGQKDQDTLPPYPELDHAVVKIVEKQGPAKSKVERWLLRRIFDSEFKRWQAPPILKVSKHSFGRGRRFPVAHRF